MKIAEQSFAANAVSPVRFSARVAFVVQDGAIAVGTPDTDPIVTTPDPGSGENPQLALYGGSTASISDFCRWISFTRITTMATA